MIDKLIGLIIILLAPLIFPALIIIYQVNKHRYWSSLRALIAQGIVFYATIYTLVAFIVYLWTKRLVAVSDSFEIAHFNRPNFFDFLSYAIFCFIFIAIGTIISFVVEAVSESLLASKISKPMPFQLFVIISFIFYLHATYIGFLLAFSLY